MKLAPIVLAVCLFAGLIRLTQAFHKPNLDRTSFSVKESDTLYEIAATYNPDKTDKVQETLDDHLKQRGDASFKNTELDATMTLNNKMTFYIKCSPGKLLLKLDKKRNSRQALARFKELGEDLRKLLTDKG